MVWYGEEVPTGQLRWFYPKEGGKKVLQQEWKIISIDHEVTLEWRTVPGVIESEQVYTDYQPNR